MAKIYTSADQLVGGCIDFTHDSFLLSDIWDDLRTSAFARIAAAATSKAPMRIH